MPTQRTLRPLPPPEAAASRAARLAEFGVPVGPLSPRHIDADASRWAALDLVSDLVCVTTTAGTLRFLNRAARDLLGLVDDAELAGTPFPMHTFAARELLVSEVVPAAIARGRTTSDTALQSSDGRVFPASQTLVHTPATDADDATITIVIRQLNLERMTAARLTDSHRLFETIARQSPDLTFLYDPADGRVLWTNRCPHSFLGAPEREARMLSQRELRRLIHPQDRATLTEGAERMAGAYGNSDTVQCEARMRSGGGAWHWVLVRVSVFSRRESGAPSLLLGLATDITARKRNEQRLIDSRDDAERAVDEAHGVLSLIAQEVRLLAAGHADQPAHTARWAALADDVAVLAHPEGDQPAMMELLDLTALVAHVAAHARRDGPLAVTLPATPITVSTAGDRFTQLLARLVRHARAGARNGTLAIAARVADSPDCRHSVEVTYIRDCDSSVSRQRNGSVSERAIQAAFAALGCELRSLPPEPDGRFVVRVYVPVPSRAAVLAGPHAATYRGQTNGRDNM